MNNNDLLLLCNKAIPIVKEASLFIKDEFGKVKTNQIITKAHNSLVSYVDQHAESMLVKSLSALIPNAGFVTEEDTLENFENEFTWIIDPLDGTTNFLYGIPHFSISVALQYRDEIILGVVSDVMKSDIYSAYKTGGAKLNNNPIHVSPIKKLDEAVIATGFPYKKDFDSKPSILLLEQLMHDCRAIRRFGSAALDLAYVASGKFQAYYESDLNPWDVAAGIIICQEAGGVCLAYNNQRSYYDGSSIIAGNAILAGHLQQLTQKIYKDYF